MSSDEGRSDHYRTDGAMRWKAEQEWLDFNRREALKLFPYWYERHGGSELRDAYQDCLQPLPARENEPRNAVPSPLAGNSSARPQASASQGPQSSEQNHDAISSVSPRMPIRMQPRDALEVGLSGVPPERHSRNPAETDSSATTERASKEAEKVSPEKSSTVNTPREPEESEESAEPEEPEESEESAETEEPEEPEEGTPDTTPENNAEPDPNIGDGGNEGWPSTPESNSGFDAGGAADFSERPPPKEKWGPHCGHKYGTTNTEYIHSHWRYDVVTDVEIYRVSTIPDDFIGASPNNNWTFEVIAAYKKYKEVDQASEELAHLAHLAPAIDGDLRGPRIRFETAQRAASLRIEFLRKWPSAFEQHGGTIEHWERALTLLNRAEVARAEGVEALRIFARNAVDYEDKPDVPVANLTGLAGRLADLGVPAMSAIAYAGLYRGKEEREVAVRGTAMRARIENAAVWRKRQVADHLKVLVSLSSFAGKKIQQCWIPIHPINDNGATASTNAGNILEITQHSHLLNKLTTNQLVRDTHFTADPEDVQGRLGKPVFALSPQQYEMMRTANDALKAALRKNLNEEEDIESLAGRNSWEYTIHRHPEAGYLDLPPLKPELEGTYRPEDARMMCSERMFRQLAGFWPEVIRLGSQTPPKC